MERVKHTPNRHHLVLKHTKKKHTLELAFRTVVIAELEYLLF